MTEQSDSSDAGAPHERAQALASDRTYEWVRTIIDELPQFVLVKNTDKEHVLVNQTVADAHGATVEQIEGTTDEQYAHEPADRDYTRDDDYVLEFGDSITIPEDRIVDAAGTERIVKSRIKRIEGPAGDKQLLVVETDISEEKQHERKLEQQRDLMEKVEQLGATGGWVLDPETETVEWTAGTKAIFGVGEDFEPTLETALSLFHPDDRDRVAASIQRCIKSHTPYELECRIVTADGETRWIQTRGQAVRRHGEVVQLRGAITEITAQKQREIELQRQNDRLEEFAHVVAHDLRNPLNYAQGYTELAEETGDLTRLPTVTKALSRMEAIVEDTLTLAREGQAVGSVEHVTADALARQCWAIIDAPEATLVCPESFGLRADPSRLSHLFENLFRNSIEHSTSKAADSDDTGQTITLGLLASGDGFYVADDGPGIAPDERETVFEAGYSTRTDGTGFGLAIVKRIAEAHDWTVSITQSTAGGARFEFTDVEVVPEQPPV